MAKTTLQAIRDKVRRITRSPTTAQITDPQVDEYINTFILYDFPEQIRTFSMRTILTFYTQPYIDTYTTNTTDPLNPLYNFINKYTAIHSPVYLAGVPGFFTQDRQYFYSIWPQTNWINDTSLRGNGVSVGPFTGSVGQSASPVLQNSVVLTSLDVLGNGMVIKDYPQAGSPLTGILSLPGQPAIPLLNYGTINYSTGAFTVTFPAAPKAQDPIYAEGILYQTSKPFSILYYEKKFVLRPVPDKVYTITVEADIRPTELLSSHQSPDEEQWWQYVALGSSIKVFQDRFDFDSVQMVFPEFKRQEDMVARKSTCQYANERTKTLYTQPKNLGGGWFISNWPY